MQRREVAEAAHDAELLPLERRQRGLKARRERASQRESARTAGSLLRGRARARLGGHAVAHVRVHAVALRHGVAHGDAKHLTRRSARRVTALRRHGAAAPHAPARRPNPRRRRRPGAPARSGAQSRRQGERSAATHHARSAARIAARRTQQPRVPAPQAHETGAGAVATGGRGRPRASVRGPPKRVAGAAFAPPWTSSLTLRTAPRRPRWLPPPPQQQAWRRRRATRAALRRCAVPCAPPAAPRALRSRRVYRRATTTWLSPGWSRSKSECVRRRGAPAAQLLPQRVSLSSRLAAQRADAASRCGASPRRQAFYLMRGGNGAELREPGCVAVAAGSLPEPQLKRPRSQRRRRRL